MLAHRGRISFSFVLQCHRGAGLQALDRRQTHAHSVCSEADRGDLKAESARLHQFRIFGCGPGRARRDKLPS